VKPEIDSVRTFIAAVLQEPLNGVDAFYRGSAKVYPEVTPSVFRSESLKRYEKDLFNSLLATHPHSFNEDPSTLDKLVRMQHHGLPTRLLDITSNPLVALYFASDSKDDEDGEVVRMEFRAVNVKYPDSDRASVMANLARLTQTQKSRLNTKLPKEEFNQLEAVQKLLHFIRQEKPYFEPLIEPRHINSIMVIRGKHSNARIIAQSGAFLLFGEKIKFEDSPKGQDIRKQNFVVKKDAKQEIRKELDQLNINQRTLFPSLGSTADYLKSKFDVALKSR
jgi:hypothetical protein